MSTQVEALMTQMERVTTELEHLRQQTSASTNDWHAAAGRINALETEVLRIGGGGAEGGRKELNFVDIKTMKPPVFAKPSDNFHAWVKKAKNYLEANCEGTKAALEKIEFLKDPVADHELDGIGLPNARKIDRKLNQFLIAYTDGIPMTFVENANGRGFEAWRRLAAEYDPMSSQSAFGKMAALMRPGRAANELEISAKVEYWEAEEKKYTDRTGNKMPEDMRMETLLSMLPTKLEEELRVRVIQPDTTYSTLRAKIMDHVHRLGSLSGKRVTTPMDCSLLGTGQAGQSGQKEMEGMPTHDPEGQPLWTFETDPHASPDYDEGLNYVGKGKGKYGGRWVMRSTRSGKKGGKEGGKGKEFEGKCHTCGKKGHRARACNSGLPALQWIKTQGKRSRKPGRRESERRQ